MSLYFLYLRPTTPPLAYLFIPLLNSNNFSPCGMLNTRMTVPYSAHTQHSETQSCQMHTYWVWLTFLSSYIGSHFPLYKYMYSSTFLVQELHWWLLLLSCNPVLRRTISDSASFPFSSHGMRLLLIWCHSQKQGSNKWGCGSLWWMQLPVWCLWRWMLVLREECHEQWWQQLLSERQRGRWGEGGRGRERGGRDRILPSDWLSSQDCLLLILSYQPPPTYLSTHTMKSSRWFNNGTSNSLTRLMTSNTCTSPFCSRTRERVNHTSTVTQPEYSITPDSTHKGEGRVTSRF